MVPPEVRREGVRGLLNFVGCALGGVQGEAMGIAVKVLTPFWNRRRCPVRPRLPITNGYNGEGDQGMARRVAGLAHIRPSWTMSMRIATYNVNGINGRLANLVGWLEEITPDVVCLQ